MNRSSVIGKSGKFNIWFKKASLSNHAGVVLIKEMADRLGLQEMIDQELAIKQRQRGYTESEGLMSLVWNLILGGDCLRDLQALRGDTGTQELVGMESIPSPVTAGELLHRFDIGDIHDLQRLLKRLADRARPYQRGKTCTIDLDASIYEQCSTRKQGSKRAYNGQIGYHPLFAFWAEEGELLMSHLLAGNRHPAGKSIWFLGEVLKRIPADKQLKLRADSAFYSWDFINECEDKKIVYAITADMTTRLRAKIEALPDKQWRQFGEELGVEVAELWYKPCRRETHRYIVKRVKLSNKVSYHAVITNDHSQSPEELMQWALERCGMENWIKEHKHGFGLEKMPTQKFHANWAWLLIGQIAFNLIAWFKRLVLPERYRTATIKTLRHHLLNLAGKIVQSSRQFFLVISDDYLFQDVWSFALARLAQLAT